MRDSLEVVVGEVVHAVMPVGEPVEKPPVVGAEVRRHAAVEEGAPQVDSVDRRRLVPRVAGAVSIDVASVVRVPGVRGKDDGDAMRAQVPRTNDEHGPSVAPPVAQ